MARPEESVFWEKKDISPCFLKPLLLKKDFGHFKKDFRWGHQGRPLGHCWGTAGAPLSNLQLVPGRDNIGDVGL